MIPKKTTYEKYKIKGKKNMKNEKRVKQVISAIVIILLVAIVEHTNILNESKIYEPTQATTTSSANINIDDLAPYSGQLVIDINNNIPYFEDKDITTEDFEDYSFLDEYKRAGVAFANICKYTMPPEGTKRGSISYKPSGWNQYLYGKNNSEHLYERCHLIAWQLANENNNKQNLITGTSKMNSAMIEYENIVANWVKQNNKQGKDYHVLYRVTPIYKGQNQLATGVEIEAKSVEEEGVSFNKFIYNVQDNFEIDYSTGKATLIE